MNLLELALKRLRLQISAIKTGGQKCNCTESLNDILNILIEHKQETSKEDKLKCISIVKNHDMESDDIIRHAQALYDYLNPSEDSIKASSSFYCHNKTENESEVSCSGQCTMCHNNDKNKQ